MRYINLSKLRINAKRADLEELERAHETLKAMTSDEERRKFINENGDKWSALATALWQLGNFKCWYSEVILEANGGEVEHFRPKNKVSKSVPPHMGYWWHAFDWRNYRIAHPLVNKRRRDYSTELLAGKGCYFPLRNEGVRAIDLAGEALEEPVLLDPTIPQDSQLLCFDTSSGRPIPRFKSTDMDGGWRYRRAKESIEYYHLDEGTWNAEREDLMRDVALACQRALEAAAIGNESAYIDILGEVERFIDPYAQFSSAAMQVVAEKGLLPEMYGQAMTIAAASKLPSGERLSITEWGEGEAEVL